MTNTILIILAIIFIPILLICIRWWFVGSEQSEQDLRDEMTIIQQTESNDTPN